MIWTISNFLSFFRLLLAIPVGIVYWQGHGYLVLIIGVVAVLTDTLDGFLARKLNQVSEAGKIIDPLADKIFVGTLIILMLLKSELPLWLGLVMISRDLLILAGGLYAKNKLKYVIPSNYAGKITVDFIIIFFIGVVFHIKPIVFYGQWVVLAGLIISLILYITKGLKLIRNK